ncbi:hypothetical protein ACFL2F_02075 [Myxococcota bacterium]
MRIAVVLLILLVPLGSAVADFELPIVSPVTKILSVPYDFDPSSLNRFTDINNLTLELVMTRGNMIPDWLVSYLKNNFQTVPVRVVLSGTIRPLHVDQLRRLPRYEVQYHPGKSMFDSTTINALYTLGPVRKIIVLSGDFSKKELLAVRKLKNYSLAVDTRGKPLSDEQLGWLSEDRHHRKILFISADFDPKKVLDLVTLRPLELQVYTKNNRIDAGLLNVLKDLKKVNFTLVVNGRVTLKDAKQFSRLERFSLRIEVKRPKDATPGMVQVLNRIAPPQTLKKARNP